MRVDHDEFLIWGEFGEFGHKDELILSMHIGALKKGSLWVVAPSQANVFLLHFVKVVLIEEILSAVHE